MKMTQREYVVQLAEDAMIDDDVAAMQDDRGLRPSNGDDD